MADKYVYGNTECTAYTEDGVRVVVHIDEPWLASDPAVKKLPHLFSPEPLDARGTVPIVEQATASPGEKRNIRRSKNTAVAPGADDELD